jgi:ribosomal-protein-alanine N-acetyltransferase
MTRDDVPVVTAIEQQVFPDPWSETAFQGELRDPAVYACVAERDGRLAGYAMTWIGGEQAHLGNLAVAPDQRRRGVALALLDDVLERVLVRNVQIVTLEVRVSNFEAQALYRNRGFRVAGLRHRYYRDGGEDALVMEWRISQALHPSSAARSQERG